MWSDRLPKTYSNVCNSHTITRGRVIVTSVDYCCDVYDFGSATSNCSAAQLDVADPKSSVVWVFSINFFTFNSILLFSLFSFLFFYWYFTKHLALSVSKGSSWLDGPIVFYTHLKLKIDVKFGKNRIIIYLNAYKR